MECVECGGRMEPRGETIQFYCSKTCRKAHRGKGKRNDAPYVKPKLRPNKYG